MAVIDIVVAQALLNDAPLSFRADGMAMAFLDVWALAEHAVWVNVSWCTANTLRM